MKKGRGRRRERGRGGEGERGERGKEETCRYISNATFISCFVPFLFLIIGYCNQTYMGGTKKTMERGAVHEGEE